MYHRDELELDLLYLRRLTGDLLRDRLRGGDLLLGGGEPLEKFQHKKTQKTVLTLNRDQPAKTQAKKRVPVPMYECKKNGCTHE